MPTAGEKRFVAAVVLPEGADAGEAFKSLPSGSLFVGESVRAEYLLSREETNLIGRAIAAALHREALK